MNESRMAYHKEDDNNIISTCSISSTSSNISNNKYERRSLMFGLLILTTIILIFIHYYQSSKTDFYDTSHTFSESTHKEGVLNRNNLKKMGQHHQSSSTLSRSSSSSSGSSSSSTILFNCPSNIPKSQNDKDEQLQPFYDRSNNNSNNNINNSSDDDSVTMINLDQIKDHKYDGWEHTYYEIKEQKRKWKTEAFASLQNGDTIFESACGEGLNLLMTLEILQEEYNITNLTIYGIEYVPTSVHRANQILFDGNVHNNNNPVTAIGSQVGQSICIGDASNLFYISNNTFDLSYTGYIDPIVDPLDLEKQYGFTTEELCLRHHEQQQQQQQQQHSTTTNNNNISKLLQLEQSIQEDWYRKWASELIRVTKPGGYIIIEEISIPICQNLNDWGGVSKQFWYNNIQNQWDNNIDPNSLYFYDTPSMRYHLMMRKIA